MEGTNPTAEELQFLDNLWHWKQGMTLEHPNLPYTYGMIGLNLETLTSIVGEGAVRKMVGERGLNSDDVVSLQVRQLLDHQMSALAHELAEGRAKGSLTGQVSAKAALTRHLPGMRKTIKKAKKAHTNRQATEVPIGDSD